MVTAVRYDPAESVYIERFFHAGPFMSITRNAKTKAFGIEQGGTPYWLRQARYYELGMDAAARAKAHFAETGRKLDLLDVGTWNGATRRYIEVHPGSEHINYHAVDLFPRGKEFVYKH